MTVGVDDSERGLGGTWHRLGARGEGKEGGGKIFDLLGHSPLAPGPFLSGALGSFPTH